MDLEIVHGGPGAFSFSFQRALLTRALLLCSVTRETKVAPFFFFFFFSFKSFVFPSSKL
jgi:hypothetical protein